MGLETVDKVGLGLELMGGPEVLNILRDVRREMQAIAGLGSNIPKNIGGVGEGTRYKDPRQQTLDFQKETDKQGRLFEDTERKKTATHKQELTQREKDFIASQKRMDVERKKTEKISAPITDREVQDSLKADQRRADFKSAKALAIEKQEIESASRVTRAMQREEEKRTKTYEEENRKRKGRLASYQNPLSGYTSGRRADVAQRIEEGDIGGGYNAAQSRQFRSRRNDPAAINDPQTIAYRTDYARSIVATREFNRAVEKENETHYQRQLGQLRDYKREEAQEISKVPSVIFRPSSRSALQEGEKQRAFIEKLPKPSTTLKPLVPVSYAPIPRPDDPVDRIPKPTKGQPQFIGPVRNTTLQQGMDEFAEFRQWRKEFDANRRKVKQGFFNDISYGPSFIGPRRVEGANKITPSNIGDILEEQFRKYLYASGSLHSSEFGSTAYRNRKGPDGNTRDSYWDDAIDRHNANSSLFESLMAGGTTGGGPTPAQKDYLNQYAKQVDQRLGATSSKPQVIPVSDKGPSNAQALENLARVDKGIITNLNSIPKPDRDPKAIPKPTIPVQAPPFVGPRLDERLKGVDSIRRALGIGPQRGDTLEREPRNNYGYTWYEQFINRREKAKQGNYDDLFKGQSFIGPRRVDIDDVSPYKTPSQINKKLDDKLKGYKDALERDLFGSGSLTSPSYPSGPRTSPSAPDFYDRGTFNTQNERVSRRIIPYSQRGDSKYDDTSPSFLNKGQGTSPSSLENSLTKYVRNLQDEVGKRIESLNIPLPPQRRDAVGRFIPATEYDPTGIPKPVDSIFPRTKDVPFSNEPIPKPEGPIFPREAISLLQAISQHTDPRNNISKTTASQPVVSKVPVDAIQPIVPKAQTSPTDLYSRYELRQAKLDSIEAGTPIPDDIQAQRDAMATRLRADRIAYQRQEAEALRRNSEQIISDINQQTRVQKTQQDVIARSLGGVEGAVHTPSYDIQRTSAKYASQISRNDPRNINPRGSTFVPLPPEPPEPPRGGGSGGRRPGGSGGGPPNLPPRPPPNLFNERGFFTSADALGRITRNILLYEVVSRATYGLANYTTQALQSAKASVELGNALEFAGDQAGRTTTESNALVESIRPIGLSRQESQKTVIEATRFTESRPQDTDVLTKEVIDIAASRGIGIDKADELVEQLRRRESKFYKRIFGKTVESIYEDEALKQITTNPFKPADELAGTTRDKGRNYLTLTDQVKQFVAGMDDASKEAAVLNYILSQQGKFSGEAEKRAQTLAGRMDIVSASFADTTEGIGLFITELKIVNDTMDLLSSKTGILENIRPPQKRGSPFPFENLDRYAEEKVNGPRAKVLDTVNSLVNPTSIGVAGAIGLTSLLGRRNAIEKYRTNEFNKLYADLLPKFGGDRSATVTEARAQVSNLKPGPFRTTFAGAEKLTAGTTQGLYNIAGSIFPSQSERFTLAGSAIRGNVAVRPPLPVREPFPLQKGYAGPDPILGGAYSPLTVQAQRPAFNEPLQRGTTVAGGIAGLAAGSIVGSIVADSLKVGPLVGTTLTLTGGIVGQAVGTAVGSGLGNVLSGATAGGLGLGVKAAGFAASAGITAIGAGIGTVAGLGYQNALADALPGTFFSRAKEQEQGERDLALETEKAKLLPQLTKDIQEARKAGTLSFTAIKQRDALDPNADLNSLTPQRFTEELQKGAVTFKDYVLTIGPALTGLAKAAHDASAAMDEINKKYEGTVPETINPVSGEAQSVVLSAKNTARNKELFASQTQNNEKVYQGLGYNSGFLNLGETVARARENEAKLQDEINRKQAQADQEHVNQLTNALSKLREFNSGSFRLVGDVANTLTDGDNPFVSIIADNATAADRMKQQWGFLGDAAVDYFTKLERSAARNRYIKTSFEELAKSMDLVNKAARERDERTGPGLSTNQNLVGSAFTTQLGAVSEVTSYQRLKRTIDPNFYGNPDQIKYQIRDAKETISGYINAYDRAIREGGDKNNLDDVYSKQVLDLAKSLPPEVFQTQRGRDITPFIYQAMKVQTTAQNRKVQEEYQKVELQSRELERLTKSIAGLDANRVRLGGGTLGLGPNLLAGGREGAGIFAGGVLGYAGGGNLTPRRDEYLNNLIRDRANSRIGEMFDSPEGRRKFTKDDAIKAYNDPSTGLTGYYDYTYDPKTGKYTNNLIKPPKTAKQLADDKAAQEVNQRAYDKTLIALTDNVPQKDLTFDQFQARQGALGREALAVAKEEGAAQKAVEEGLRIQTELNAAVAQIRDALLEGNLSMLVQVQNDTQARIDQKNLQDGAGKGYRTPLDQGRTKTNPNTPAEKTYKRYGRK